MAVFATARGAARVSRREFAKALIDRSIKEALRPLPGKLRRSFVQLLSDVQARSALFRPCCYEGKVGPGAVAAALNGLVALANHRHMWLRPMADWGPMEGLGPFDTFSSVAHHLLANYPVPPVLVSAWFQGLPWPGAAQQTWFHRAGRGVSLREVGFPVALTKRMAFELWRVPRELGLMPALRWAQVKGMGGGDELARAVVGSRLGKQFYPDPFWSTVVRFFVNQRGLDLAHVGPVVEYLYAQKFEGEAVVIGGDVAVDLDPPQPDLTMKGRTLAALLCQAAAWRERKAEAAEHRALHWGRAPIAEYDAPGEDGRLWTVRQLLDGDALAAEGKAMDHCVATYAANCLAGRSWIWSIGVEGEEGRERVATVEVAPEGRQVVQAKAYDNDEPPAEALAVLHAWAGREGLVLDE